MTAKLSLNNITVCILSVIVFTAFLVRIYRLDLIPLNLDEACETIKGIEAIKGGWAEKIFNVPITFSHGKIPLLYAFLALIPSYFFIHPMFVARLPALFFGTLTIFATFLLAKRLYNYKVGLLSALFLALLPWHIIQSRIGIRIIMVPFFGTLIFYLLCAALETKKSSLLLLSFLMLGLGSLYTYPSALIFIPAYAISLLILRRNLGWPKISTILAGAILFCFSISAISILSTKIDLIKSQAYHSIFTLEINRLLKPENYYKLLQNFYSNFKAAFQLLFFSNLPPESLYAPSIKHPLLLSKFYFLLFSSSLVYSLLKRRKGDYIMLIWLSLGFILPSLVVIEGMCARYLFVILPVPIILISRLLIEGFRHSGDFRSTLLKITSIVIIALIISYSLKILFSYYMDAPANREEWTMQSLGSQQAAKFLFDDNAEQKYKVYTDFRMVVSAHLNYYINSMQSKKEIFNDINNHFEEMTGPRNFTAEGWSNKENQVLSQGNTIYYFLWSPKTHDREDNWGIQFKKFYRVFRILHPWAEPAKEILYPDGSVAIEVFKVSPQLNPESQESAR